MAEEVADRVVVALSSRFDALDKSIASLKDGQWAHAEQLQAIRDMLDLDTASVGKIDRLERRLLKVERTQQPDQMRLGARSCLRAMRTSDTECRFGLPSQKGRGANANPSPAFQP